MKKNLFIILLSLTLSQNSYAQTAFQNIYGTALYNKAGVSTASPDAFYLLHNVTIPSYANKLIKVDLNGNLLWAKEPLFSLATIGIMRIHYSNNHLLVTGAHQNAGYMNFLAKLDTAGNVLWTTEISYGDINLNARIHSNAAGYLLTGHRDYIGGASSYTFDITLAQFDVSGNLLWAKAYGNNSYDFVCNASVITTNGETMITGLYGLRNTLDFDPMIARFDASGNLLWMKTFSDASGFFTDFFPSDITNTSDGNFALTGMSENTNANFDAQVVKFDGSGNILWGTRLYQISWHEAGRSIISDSQSNLIVAGSYELGAAYGDFAARLDNSGILLAAAKMSNTHEGAYFNFGSYYDIRGSDLFELTGFGYAYATKFKLASNDHRHGIVTTDYNGVLNCAALGGTYPFSYSPITWTTTTFTNLPGAQTNITASAVVFTTSSITETSGDVCPLVGVDELNVDNTGISVYPNPVSEELIVTSPDMITEIKITDAFGKEIYFRQAQPTLNFKFQTLNLTNGIYFIEVTSGNKKEKTKFLKLDN